MAFIFSDAEVKEEGFLEFINQLLMTGEVTGLFPKDELDAVINDIRPIYLAECPGESCCLPSPLNPCALSKLPVRGTHVFGSRGSAQRLDPRSALTGPEACLEQGGAHLLAKGLHLKFSQPAALSLTALHPGQ